MKGKQIIWNICDLIVSIHNQGKVNVSTKIINYTANFCIHTHTHTIFLRLNTYLFMKLLSPYPQKSLHIVTYHEQKWKYGKLYTCAIKIIKPLISLVKKLVKWVTEANRVLFINIRIHRYLFCKIHTYIFLLFIHSSLVRESNFWCCSCVCGYIHENVNMDVITLLCKRRVSYN